LGLIKKERKRWLNGIDVDDYSRTGGINYKLFKKHLLAGESDFMIIKAGLGTHRSTIFNEQKQNAEFYGIPYITYHLLDPGMDMKQQAQNYVDWVGADQPSYIMDVESPREGARLPNKAELRTYIDEMERLTNKQPVIYTRTNVLEQVGFLDEARKYRLWIAQYLNDITQIPKKQVQYRFFHEFVRDFSKTLPPSVVRKPIEESVILWQFSEKGDGYFYVYNPITEHPRYTTGKKSADLNISIRGREEFLKSIFGKVPVIEEGVENGGGVRPPQTTYPGLDNQDIVNFIFRVAKAFTSDPWKDWVVPAKLEFLAVPTANRSKPYTGPKIEDIPTIPEAAKKAILGLMDTAHQVLGLVDQIFPKMTNQEMMLLIFKAALPFTDDPWNDWIVRANLEELAVPNENRGKPYTGPRIENLPNLSKAEKDAILALL
jgi:GH25 family lysozyme M1 (1,4-beta-N-acetylmuramidase)